MRRADLIVVGAGPAGAHAAMTAADAGLDVVLLDEAALPGGQVYRAPPAEFRVEAKSGTDQAEGDALRASISRSAVDWRGGRRVWTVTDRFRVDAIGPGGSEACEAPRLIAATGAYERVVPFPGWTLPGVIGLAAATILLKAQGMAPAERVLVAGCGPLLLAVAAKVLAAGAEVIAVIDIAGPGDWLRSLPKLATRPSLLRQGAAWALTIGLKRVPILFRHAVLKAEGEDTLDRVTVAPVDAEGRPRPGGRLRVFQTGCLAIGHGLVPGAEVPKLLGAALHYDRCRGGWLPVVDGDGRTSIPGLYTAGDGAGIAGAIPAVVSGKLAGRAAAMDSGRNVAADEGLRTARDRSMPFANAMAGLMALRRAQVDAIPNETVVCRCEDVTRAEIESAIAAGGREVNQLKHFTRCGMGPCQGRMCGDVVGELVASYAGSREAAGYWTGRPPLRPVPLDALLGTFDYDDIPVPAPAPL